MDVTTGLSVMLNNLIISVSQHPHIYSCLLSGQFSVTGKIKNLNYHGYGYYELWIIFRIMNIVIELYGNSIMDIYITYPLNESTTWF